MENKSYKYFDIICALFVAVLIISNIASVKVAQVGGFNFDGGTILFPIAYIFGDILTEVYGYARARRAIWIGFFSLISAAATFAAVQHLPSAADWQGQAAYEQILGFVPRLVTASVIAYLAGEFINSFILAKMKIWTKGRHLWTRTISSTVAGQAADSLVFSVIAFYGVLPLGAMLNLMGTIYVFKVLYEILATPLTYAAVSFLKRKEGADVFDQETNFNPLAIS